LTKESINSIRSLRSLQGWGSGQQGKIQQIHKENTVKSTFRLITQLGLRKSRHLKERENSASQRERNQEKNPIRTNPLYQL
jgi:hypothetical protein